jgi:hypothetical protein
LANAWTAQGSWKRLFVARKRRFPLQGLTGFYQARIAEPAGASAVCDAVRHCQIFVGGAASQFAISLTRERTMGLFDRLFGSTTTPAHQFFAKFKRKSQAPTDPDLFKIAKDRKGHISRKAVLAEYNRLVLEKYVHDKA